MTTLIISQEILHGVSRLTSFSSTGYRVQRHETFGSCSNVTPVEMVPTRVSFSDSCDPCDFIRIRTLRVIRRVSFKVDLLKGRRNGLEGILTSRQILWRHVERKEEGEELRPSLKAQPDYRKDRGRETKSVPQKRLFKDV